MRNIGYLPSVRAPSAQASCEGPLRVHRSGGEWCCAAAVTHMYTHLDIHVDGVWCVCGALPYSLTYDSATLLLFTRCQDCNANDFTGFPLLHLCSMSSFLQYDGVPGQVSHPDV